MKRLWLILLASPASAQQAGWGNVGQPEEKPFSWTAPLWPDFWMAWTPATFVLFCAIFGAIALIGLLEGFRYPDGLERTGALGLTTTLGDRLFISLLGTVFIFLIWLWIFGQPVWWPLGLGIAWGIFVFWKV